ncbi:HlyC/CorC family transporter [Pedomonas mirosovicensis]|uniref:HlyC/CorC family transporter n=1 Tax=Pedomonas mirosovicensis TaxID=2908641 RepID=UPI0021695323|nr:CNNM domain-containing protein [Pedomonas mirosovicensis]MCH8685797.1 CNNM domain-containing protein [Pedomonas mirosovicensis]
MTLTDIALLGAAFALILASAVLETAGMSLAGSSASRIHRMAREGDRRALRAEKLLGQRDRLNRAAILGAVLLNTLAASLVTFALADAFGTAAVLYAALSVTALVFLLAEALPRAIAPTRPEPLALRLAPALEIIARPLGPLADALVRLIRRPLARLHVGGNGNAPAYGPMDAIRRLEGMIDLDETLADDVMVHRRSVEMLDIATPPAQIVRIVTRSRHTRLPVYRDDPDNIIGILHSKNLLRALAKRGARPETLIIGKLLSPAWFVPNTTSLREQLNAFIARRSQFALVVDEYGSFQGVITLADILAQVLGDITDTEDRPTPQGVIINDNGSLTVEGTVTIRDLNRRFGWDLPEDDANTIAGLLINAVRVIPVKGQSFTYYGLRFDVLERRRNQITQLRLTPLGRETVV